MDILRPGVGLLILITVGVLAGTRFGATRRDAFIARFRAVMDSSPNVAFLKDGNGRLLYVNHAHRGVFKFPPEQLVGRLQRELLPPAVAEQLLANDRKVLESKCAQAFRELIPGEGEASRTWPSFKVPKIGGTS